MKNIKKRTIAIILIIVIILTSFTYIQVRKHQASEKVMQYLTEEKGYEESDIKSLKSIYSFLGIPTYSVNVTFTNEPNIVYCYFSHHAKGQFEYYDINDKSIPVKDLKNYDPNTE